MPHPPAAGNRVPARLIGDRPGCYAPAMPNTPTPVYEGRRENHAVTVTVDGEPLDPRFDLRRHSDGFEFGYGGSGPAQLALAILSHALGDDELARAHYQKFKFQVIGKLQQSPWRITQLEVRTWIASVLAARSEPTE